MLLIVEYTNIAVITTAIITILCAGIIWKNTVEENCEFIKKNIIFTAICIFLTIAVMVVLYIKKKTEVYEQVNGIMFNPFKIRYLILSMISAAYLGIYIGNKLKNWLVNFYKSLDTWEKRAYIITSLVSVSIIIIAYSFSNRWYTLNDIIYSLDSGRNLQRYVTPTYYDIRHPLIDLYVFPFYTIINLITDIILPNSSIAPTIQAIFYQIVNSQLIILIALQLKKLTENKKVFILYMISFPTMLFTMFFEKFQICTFLLVLYVFTICIQQKGKDKINVKEENARRTSIILATGAMLTSAFIGIAELFTKNKIVDKIKVILKIIVISVLTFICLGRVHIIWNGINEITDTKESFTNQKFTVQEKIVSTVNFVKSIIIALPSGEADKSLVTMPSGVDEITNIYWWNNLQSDISIVAIGIIGIAIIGAIKNRKEFFVKIASIWFVFSFVLFVILNWATQETPLFALYFSWAIVPLFVMGMDFILLKTKINSKFAYTFLFVLITVINVVSMVDISKFMMLL